jgi:CHAD domain-containing protein
MTATPPGIRDYALDRVNHLLTRLVFQVHRAAKVPGPEEIHDVRVSIRRFSQCLLLFEEFFPRWEVKKIKRRLKRMLRLTSQIRDRDIALDFLASLKQTRHRQRLVKTRLTLQKEFSQMIRHWNVRNFSARWRNGLSLRNT